MPPTQRSPRLARSARQTIQDHPANAPNTDKTTTKSAKTAHLDRTISSKTLDFRPFQRLRKNSAAKLSTHRPEQAERSRTEPNKPERTDPKKPEKT